MIYISGKITGDADYKKHFDCIAGKVASITEGQTVFNPANIDLGKDASWSDYLKIDIPVLLECSTIVMLNDWEQSRGALLEWNIARAMNMKIIYENEL